MTKVSARHILVETRAHCEELKAEVKAGASFHELAQEHSRCPSRTNGGRLGVFSQGQMVPEFDQVAFSAPLNKVQGPVKTKFGYHLIEVLSRED